jgi:hypothetical protein
MRQGVEKFTRIDNTPGRDADMVDLPLFAIAIKRGHSPTVAAKIDSVGVGSEVGGVDPVLVEALRKTELD